MCRVFRVWAGVWRVGLLVLRQSHRPYVAEAAVLHGNTSEDVMTHPAVHPFTEVPSQPAVPDAPAAPKDKCSK